MIQEHGTVEVLRVHLPRTMILYYGGGLSADVLTETFVRVVVGSVGGSCSCALLDEPFCLGCSERTKWHDWACDSSRQVGVFARAANPIRRERETGELGGGSMLWCERATTYSISPGCNTARSMRLRQSFAPQCSIISQLVFRTGDCRRDFTKHEEQRLAFRGKFFSETSSPTHKVCRYHWVRRIHYRRCWIIGPNVASKEESRRFLE